MRFSPTWSMTIQGWLVLFASSPSLSLLFIHFSINSFSLCLCWRCPGITLTYKRQSQKWNSLKKIISSGRRTTLLGRLWLEKGLGCSDVQAVSCHVAGKLDRMKEERWTEMADLPAQGLVCVSWPNLLDRDFFTTSHHTFSYKFLIPYNPHCCCSSHTHL